MAQSNPSLLAGIPTLDIRAFINGSEAEKAAFAAALGEEAVLQLLRRLCERVRATEPVRIRCFVARLEHGAQ